MSDKIFIKQDGVECAVDMDQLKELLRKDCVKPQAQMRKEGDSGWKSAVPFIKSIGLGRLIKTGILGTALISNFSGSETQAAVTDNIGESIDGTEIADVNDGGIIESVTDFFSSIFG